MTFTDHGVTAINPEKGTSSGGKGIDGCSCSEKENKLTWMHDTRITLFMEMELMACRHELD